MDEAGPLTRSVLIAMQPHLRAEKRFCYVDSKIQFFEPGDSAVDSRHYHLDGTIVIRGKFAESLGYPLLHDIRARIFGPARPPQYLSYQSSVHCPTLFVDKPLTIEIPDFIPNFEIFSDLVLAANPSVRPQPAASIVSSNGLTVHTATSATSSGWRLWVRTIETDREIVVTPEVSTCYNSVYRS